MIGDKFIGRYLAADYIFLACLAVFPIFFLTLEGWMSRIFFLTCGVALYIIVKEKIKGVSLIPDHVDRRWMYLVMAVLASAPIAILLGQLFRRSFAWPYYDAPVRFLFSILIVLVIVHKRINIFKLLEYSIPASVYIAAVSAYFNPGTIWGADRVTTYFADPLTFGSVMLTFAMISLLSINMFQSDALWLKLYKAAGFATGVCFSVISGSGTGWLSLPIVLLIWLFVRMRERKKTFIAAGISVVLLLPILMYHFAPPVRDKVDVSFNSLLQYKWNEVNDDNSLSMRISFWRMGVFFFLQNPLGGWGDESYKTLIDSPEISRYASPFTREFVVNTGFHNEFIANVVRSGIWGFLSTTAIFLVPLVFFIRHFLMPYTITRKMALPALAYMICTLVSGMTMDVFNLKYTTAFHAMMISCLCGSMLVSAYFDKKRIHS